MVVHGLPDDELATYRERIDAVEADDVLQAARTHIHVDRAAAVLVGDASVVASSLEVVGFGPVEVIRDDDETAEA